MRTVIMGGTSGIGLAVATKVADAGHDVIVTGRDEERPAAVPKEVAVAEQVNGTSEAAVAEFCTRTGSFDHLVLALSPGAVGLGPVRGAKLDDIRAAFEGKLLAYLLAVQHAEVTGSITMVSAASARAAMPGTVTLSAVNGAIERIVPPLAAELAPVRVNAVAPGVVDTPWWSFLPADQRRAQFASMADGVPVGRVGRPDDVADAVHYLLDATFVTGTVLPVDGGMTMA